MSTAPIRVLVAEDVPLIRHAVVALLRLQPDLAVVAEVERGDHVLPAARTSGPDVAVLDIDMPGLDGLACARQLHADLPACRSIVLTGLGRPATLLRALEAHVRGFLVKDAPADTLVDTIRRVVAGERVIDPQLLGLALETGASPLTERETAVLRAAARGDSTAHIAKELYLSATTVRNYLSSAIAKVGARNRIDAIRISENAGWL